MSGDVELAVAWRRVQDRKDAAGLPPALTGQAADGHRHRGMFAGTDLDPDDVQEVGAEVARQTVPVVWAEGIGTGLIGVWADGLLTGLALAELRARG